MYLILICLCCAMTYVFTAPSTNEVPPERLQPTVIPILSLSAEYEPNGTYKYSYETGNGIKREETAYDKELPEGKSNSNCSNEGGEDDDSSEIHVQKGSYSYTAPDGTLVSVRYIADENGFQPINERIQFGSQTPRTLLENTFEKSELPVATTTEKVKLLTGIKLKPGKNDNNKALKFGDKLINKNEKTPEGLDLLKAHNKGEERPKLSIEHKNDGKVKNTNGEISNTIKPNENIKSVTKPMKKEANNTKIKADNPATNMSFPTVEKIPIIKNEKSTNDTNEPLIKGKNLTDKGESLAGNKEHAQKPIAENENLSKKEILYERQEKAQKFPKTELKPTENKKPIQKINQNHTIKHENTTDNKTNNNPGNNENRSGKDIELSGNNPGKMNMTEIKLDKNKEPTKNIQNPNDDKKIPEKNPITNNEKLDDEVKLDKNKKKTDTPAKLNSDNNKENLIKNNTNPMEKSQLVQPTNKIGKLNMTTANPNKKIHKAETNKENQGDNEDTNKNQEIAGSQNPGKTPEKNDLHKEESDKTNEKPNTTVKNSEKNGKASKNGDKKPSTNPEKNDSNKEKNIKKDESKEKSYNNNVNPAMEPDNLMSLKKPSDNKNKTNNNKENHNMNSKKSSNDEKKPANPEIPDQKEDKSVKNASKPIKSLSKSDMKNGNSDENKEKPSNKKNEPVMKPELNSGIEKPSNNTGNQNKSMKISDMNEGKPNMTKGKFVKSEDLPMDTNKYGHNKEKVNNNEEKTNRDKESAGDKNNTISSGENKPIKTVEQPNLQNNANNSSEKPNKYLQSPDMIEKNINKNRKNSGIGAKINSNNKDKLDMKGEKLRKNIDVKSGEINEKSDANDISNSKSSNPEKNQRVLTGNGNEDKDKSNKKGENPFMNMENHINNNMNPDMSKKKSNESLENPNIKENVLGANEKQLIGNKKKTNNLETNENGKKPSTQIENPDKKDAKSSESKGTPHVNKDQNQNYTKKKSEPEKIAKHAADAAVKAAGVAENAADEAVAAAGVAENAANAAQQAAKETERLVKTANEPGSQSKYSNIQAAKEHAKLAGQAAKEAANAAKKADKAADDAKQAANEAEKLLLTVQSSSDKVVADKLINNSKNLVTNAVNSAKNAGSAAEDAKKQLELTTNDSKNMPNSDETSNL